MLKVILLFLFLPLTDNKELLSMIFQEDRATLGAAEQALYSLQEDSSTPNADEYAVYSTYLNGIEKNLGNGKAISLVVLNGQTIPADSGCFPVVIAKQNKIIANNELTLLFQDLEAKEKVSKLIKNSFNVKHGHELLDKNDFDALVKPESISGWNEYYKKYPNSSGYISLSRVGFNADTTKAIVFRVIRCGKRCASADYFLFEKTNGQWKQINSINCWVS